jgi:hypothetical protein
MENLASNKNLLVKIAQLEDVYKKLGQFNRVDVEVYISASCMKLERESTRRFTWMIDDQAGNGKTVLVTWGDQCE